MKACAVICRKATFTLPDATYPSARAQECCFCARESRKWGGLLAKAHKNADFVLERPQNGCSEGKKRTKTPILCSKCLKMGVPEGKSAQKPRFCARKAQKRGSRTTKKHKNADFVLKSGTRQQNEVDPVSDLAHNGVAHRGVAHSEVAHRGVAHRGVAHQYAGAYWPDAGEVLVISLPITSRSSVTLSRLPFLKVPIAILM